MAFANSAAEEEARVLKSLSFKEWTGAWDLAWTLRQPDGRSVKATLMRLRRKGLVESRLLPGRSTLQWRRKWNEIDAP